MFRSRFLKPLLTALVFAVLWPLPTRAAQQAQITLLPTRIVMGNGDRFATVFIKNSGQATGNYRASLIDMQMKENGDVVALDPGQTDPYSAIPFIRIAPRSFELKSGESIAVRIVLRKPKNLPPGEYRAHLKLNLVNDHVAPAQLAALPPKGISFVAKPHIIVVIPVIFRYGKTTLSMKIENAKLDHQPDGKPVLDMYLAREGNRSSMGDITVNYLPPGGGAAQLLKSYPGIPVYRGTARRFVAVPLDVPAGVSLSHGSLDILYKAQASENYKELAEARLPLE